MDDKLREIYPFLGRSKTAKKLGKTERWVKRHASRLGLRVCPAIKSKNQSEGIKKAYKNKDLTGKNNHAYGIKRPDLIKLNKSRAGIPLSDDVKDKISESLRKVNGNYTGKNWTRKSLSWRFKRKIIDKAGKCCLCGAKDELEVDHIKPYATHPELLKEITNLRVLCRACHIETETYGAKVKKYKIQCGQSEGVGS